MWSGWKGREGKTSCWGADCAQARPDGPCVHDALAGLTARRPDLMAHVLSLHNGIMDKAKDDNFGSIIKQEGGELEGGQRLGRAGKAGRSSDLVARVFARP